MMASVVVELEPGVWLADGEGDPPRTLQIKNARKFRSAREATVALTEARKHRPFPNAVLDMWDEVYEGLKGQSDS